MMDKNLLLIAPDSGNTNVYLHHAFQGLDWSVTEIDYRQHLAHHGPRHLSDTVFHHATQADLTLIFKGEVFSGPWIEALSEHAGPIALWDHDPRHQSQQAVIDRYRHADYALTMAEGMVDPLREAGCNAHLVLLACHPDHHYPLPVDQDVDVGFIGTVKNVSRGPNPYRNREDWLNYLNQGLNTNIHVWGSYPGAAEAFCTYHGRAEGNAGHRTAVSRTKINLGSDRNPEIARSYGARLFWVLGTGGFLLTNATTGIHDDFDGRLAIAHDDDEFIELTQYYLDNDEERQRIAKKGRDFVLDHHTYTHRAQEIIDICGV